MTRPKLLLACVIVLCVCTYGVAPTNPSPADIIPSHRAIDWSQAGVPGGIPNRTTICASLNPGASAIDINNAIAACSNGVVDLNAGTFNLSNGITFGGRSNVTLRGAGPDQTILKFSASDPCGGLSANVCIFAPSYVYPGNIPSTNMTNWTAGYAKGTIQITLDSTAGLTVGTVLVLDQLDDDIDAGSVFVGCGPTISFELCPPSRSGRSQQQYVTVTAINGNQVTIASGLYMPNWRASQQPQAWWWGTGADMNGVENLTVDHTNSTETAGIVFHGANGGWVKNVKSLNANRNHVWLQQAARLEVRDSYFYGTKSAAAVSYGVDFFLTSADLVINNIFQHVTAPIMIGPSAGSVVAYNYVIDMHYDAAPTWMAAGLAGSHDAGTGMHLFESNVGNQFLMDTNHGTGNLATLFRNRLTGTEPNKTQTNTIPVNIRAYNRLVNIVGNVLGTSGYHTVYENSQLPSGTPGNPDRSIYVLGYPGGDEQYPVAGIGYDAVVVSSLLRWGNYDYATNQTRWDAAEIPSGVPVPTTQNLPASLFLSAKPSWWGTMPWPAIGPDVTGGQDPAGHGYKIPAQVCYETSSKNGDGTLIFDARNCY
jgi:hypothetical protein